MIRAHESPVALQAGALSLLVHGLFFVLLVVGFSWRQAVSIQVAEVELWDRLPEAATPVSPPLPATPTPEIRPEPKPEPKPEPPPPAPKADIVVKAKSKPEPRPESKPKPDKKPAPKAPAKPNANQAEDEARQRLEALQRELLAEDDPRDVQQKEAQQLAEARAALSASAAVPSDALDKYRAGIQAKIRRYVNRQVCGTGKPVLEFGIALMPTGEVVGTPRLQKSSGMPACDQAVERAILQAQPLPVPREPELFAQFRELSLQFRPNDDH